MPAQQKRNRKARGMLQFPVEVEQLIWKAYFTRHVAPPLLHANLSKRVIVTLQNPPISDDRAYNLLAGYIFRELPDSFIKEIEELLRAVRPTVRFLQLFRSVVESLEAGMFPEDTEEKELAFEIRAESILVLFQAAARNQVKREHR